MPRGKLKATYPLHTLSVDIHGVMTPCKGNRFIVTFTDVFSRYAILTHTQYNMATTVTLLLYTHIITYFSTPIRILSTMGGKSWAAYGISWKSSWDAPLCSPTPTTPREIS